MKVFALLMFLASVAVAQHKGDTPPALVWDDLRGNCRAELDWKSLQAEVVVISVGADDVFPEDISDWDEVPKALKGEPVVFLQVVSGSAFLLDQALAKTPYQGCVLVDSHDLNRIHFGLPALPRTVIIDQAGYVAGFSRGGPDEYAVRAVLNHQIDTTLSEVPLLPKPLDTKAGLDQARSYEVHIAPARSRDLRLLGEDKPDTYTVRNQPLKVAILDLWDSPMARISFPKDLDSGNYNITAHIPVPDRALLLKLVRDAVQTQLGLRIETELRTQRVYLMTAANHPSSQLKPADAAQRWMTGGSVEGSLIGTSQTMREIAMALEDLLEVPVLEETNLPGTFDYSASTKLSGLQAATDLAHQLGLELTPVERPIEMLVVKKVN